MKKNLQVADHIRHLQGAAFSYALRLIVCLGTR